MYDERVDHKIVCVVHDERNRFDIMVIMIVRMLVSIALRRGPCITSWVVHACENSFGIMACHDCAHTYQGSPCITS